MKIIQKENYPAPVSHSSSPATKVSGLPQRVTGTARCQRGRNEQKGTGKPESL